MDKFDIDSLKNHNAKLFTERESLRVEIAELSAKVRAMEIQPPKIIEKIVEVKQPPKIIEKIVEVENTARIKSLQAQLNHVEAQLKKEKAKPPRVVKQQVVTRESDTVRLLKEKVKELNKQIDMLAQRLNERADHGGSNQQ